MGTVMKIAPCKDCPDRHQGCHAECARYAEWSALNTAKGRRNYDKHAADDFIIDGIMKGKKAKDWRKRP